ncbi:MAG: hypothetical protein GY719_38325 [bacterium]|nr:hypothetical protein [bacterium]
MSTRSKPSNKVEAVLTYLQHRLPAYPFDAKIDQDFVEELVDDFGGVDVLEEIKNFRWFNDSKPVSHLRSVRLALRRWIGNSRKRKTS